VYVTVGIIALRYKRPALSKNNPSLRTNIREKTRPLNPRNTAKTSEAPARPHPQPSMAVSQPVQLQLPLGRSQRQAAGATTLGGERPDGSSNVKTATAKPPVQQRPRHHPPRRRHVIRRERSARHPPLDQGQRVHANKDPAILRIVLLH